MRGQCSPEGRGDMPTHLAARHPSSPAAAPRARPPPRAGPRPGPCSASSPGVPPAASLAARRLPRGLPGPHPATRMLGVRHQPARHVLSPSMPSPAGLCCPPRGADSATIFAVFAPAHLRSVQRPARPRTAGGLHCAISRSQTQNSFTLRCRQLTLPTPIRPLFVGTLGCGAGVSAAVTAPGTRPAAAGRA